MSELLRLKVADVFKPRTAALPAMQRRIELIDVIRKGRKPGYVIAPASLLEETAGYLSTHGARGLHARGAARVPIRAVRSS